LQGAELPVMAVYGNGRSYSINLSFWGKEEARGVLSIFDLLQVSVKFWFDENDAVDELLDHSIFILLISPVDVCQFSVCLFVYGRLSGGGSAFMLRSVCLR
jgi:hypothetical protein